MSSVQSSNRRRGERLTADFVVCVYHEGVCLGAYRTRDLSRGGLSLRPSRIMFWPGTTVEVAFRMPAGSRSSSVRRLPAVVRYCRPDGMGLGFRAPLSRGIPSTKSPART